MRKLFVVAAVMLALALPLAGQAPQGQGQRMPMADPDKNASGGIMIAGWEGRTDYPTQRLASLRFATMGNGMHVTTGPAAVLYQPTRMAKGEYQVRATFSQTKLPEHQEAYGIFIGGANLQGEGQRYTYFLLRQDGKFLIKKRQGAQTPTVIDWTDNPAVNKPDAQSRQSNALSISVGKDTVRFLVNGKEVASQPRSAIDADGVVGLRINHNLDVHVADFSVQTGS